MILPVQVHWRRLLSCLALLLLIPGAWAFTVTPVTYSPSDVLNPNDRINASCTVYAAQGVAFPSYDDLQLVTELDDPIWSYTIIVNDVENIRPVKRGKILTISGFELAYENKDDVIVRIALNAQVPPSAAPGADTMIMKIQELDARSNVLTNSVVRVDHLIGLPTPTPTPAFGSIAISSEPAGAGVYLDNVIRGITPVTLDGISNGPHTVLLRSDGYRDYTRDVTVMAGAAQVNAVLVPQTVTITPTLSPGSGTSSVTGSPVALQPAQTPGTGTLSVMTSPTGAIVYIDGEMKGITPATIPGLSPGSHSIVLIMDGYQDFKTTTEITSGTTSEFLTGLAKKKQAPGFALAAAVLAIGISALWILHRGRKE